MICAHNCVRTFDFVPRIWSRPHDKDCLYILCSSKNSYSYILTSRDSTYTDTHILSLSQNFDLQRQHSVCLSVSSFSTSRNSLTLPVNKTQFNTRNMRIHSATFFFLVLRFRLALFHPRTQPQKFRQIPKETTNQHGRKHISPRIHYYISVYWYLACIL